MQFPPLRRALIERYLPKELLALVDLNQIQTMPTKFAQANKTIVPDSVLRAPYVTGKGWLYAILEQQTNPNDQIPLRLTLARGRVLEFDLNQHSELPPIIWTLILANGNQRWTGSLDIYSKLPAAARKWAHRCISKPPQLVQLIDMPPIKKSSCPELDAMLLLMQKAHDDPAGALIDSEPLLQAIPRQYRSAMLNEMFLYTLTADGHKSSEEFIMRLKEGLCSDVRREIMSIAQVLRQEGKEEGKEEGEKIGMQKGEKVGMQKGKKEGLETAAIGMLKEGLALEQVRKITHLSKERITQLLARFEHKLAGGR